jgi:3-hydroxyisobutyrate dehydrogenase/2-hydroxy-3-oxopropionate reductase
MGAAMARRFAAAGYRLTVWNRDRAKAEAVAGETGARIADTPADAAANNDFVVSSMADDEALRAVYLGPDGVVEGSSEGLVAADTSTVAPETVTEVGASMDRTGADFLDCPVSGSVTTVEAGGLTVMAGGEPEAIDRIEPVLGAIAKRVIRVGSRGAGAVCKLAVNGLVHGINVSLAEALVLAEKAGVDRSLAYEVFVSGVGGAPYVQYKRDAFENPDEAAVAFTLQLVEKDLELITGLASRVGAPMAQAETGLDIVSKANAAGMGQRDMSAVAVFLRDGGG